MLPPCDRCLTGSDARRAHRQIVPILRAGLVLLEDAATLLPAAQTFHLGLVRDEETLEASMYLNKLPERYAQNKATKLPPCAPCFLLSFLPYHVLFDCLFVAFII